MILLDTHIILWLVLEPELLSQKAKKAIQEMRSSGDGIAISAITLFEIAQLVERGRVKLEIPVEQFLDAVEDTCVVLPIHSQIACRSQRFTEAYPRDPAHRIIGATAIAQGISLVTADDRIRRSREVPTIW